MSQSTRKLAQTLVATSFLTFVLAALLASSHTRLEAVRSLSFELDEPWEEQVPAKGPRATPPTENRTINSEIR
jgi:hypothetical protein